MKSRFRSQALFLALMRDSATNKQAGFKNLIHISQFMPIQTER